MLGLPRHEMTLDITWIPKDMKKAIDEGTYSKSGAPLGPMEIFSPPIRSILDTPYSSAKNDTYTNSIGKTIMAALERKYPEAISASIKISCTVTTRKEDKD